MVLFVLISDLGRYLGGRLVKSYELEQLRIDDSVQCISIEGSREELQHARAEICAIAGAMQKHRSCSQPEDEAEIRSDA